LSEAEETLKAGISATPQEPSLYDLLGTVLQREKKYAEALETLYKSIALDSTSTTPYVTIGFIYDDLDSTEKAISTYETALLIDSSDALVMNNYAYLLAEANIRLEEAKKMSAKSLEAEPENPSYLDTMGWIYYRLKDYSEAEKYLVKALKLANNPIMYLHLGDVLRDAGQITRAQEIYRKGLEIAPDDYELKQRVENK
jgi:tetratricopeptide (TPR) repeat protein